MRKFNLTLVLVVLTGYLSAQQVFTTFQKASMVIGQPNFTSNYSDPSDSITRGPSYCAVSSQGMLAVAEQSGSSVKIWHSMPTRNGQPSDVQISLPFSANGLDWSPDGNKLIVAGGSSSIYIWDSIPMVDNKLNNITITLYTNYPQGVLVTPDGKLLIAERYGNRILVWNSIPTLDNTPADYVIGQPDMNTINEGNGPGNLSDPWGLDLSPDGRLLIADESNHRVVVYDSVPETFGDTATVVIGQTGFGLSNNGCSDSTQSTTVGVTVTVDGIVAISEFGNNRVTIFDSVPSSNNAKASAVLGQPDFNSNTQFYPSGSPDTNNMRRPYTISSDLNGRLFLCGRDMNRVLVFGELPSDSADLSILITAASTSLCDSSTVVYKMQIKNMGPDTAKNIISTTAFAQGFKLNNIIAVNGTYNDASGYWNIPYISPGDSTILFLGGMVDSNMAGKTIVTYANIIYSSAVDTNLLNNGTSKSVLISNSTRPADPITADTTTCYGYPAKLSASGEGTFNWYANVNDLTPLASGATYNTIPLTAPSTYYVEAFSECPSANRVPVNVTINPIYTKTVVATICKGESYILGSQVLTEAGTYTEFFTAQNSCDSIINLQLTINSVNTEVTQNGNTLTANETDGTYQWLSCSTNSEIEGESGRSYKGLIPGDYAVIISTDGCADTSSCYTIAINGVKNTESNFGITIYPNPVKDYVILDFGTISDEVTITVLNNNGQRVINTSCANKQQINIDVQELPSGVYFIQIQSAQKISNFRMIKE